MLTLYNVFVFTSLHFASRLCKQTVTVPGKVAWARLLKEITILIRFGIPPFLSVYQATHYINILGMWLK